MLITKLFSKHNYLCNPSIVEYKDGLLGLVKRWNFDNNPHFEGDIFLFRLNKKMQLEYMKKIPSMSGLRDYTIYKDKNKIFVLIFHKNKIFKYNINQNEVKYITSLRTENIDCLKSQSFSNKNFSPIKISNVIFIYSLNPYILLSLEQNSFSTIYRGIYYKELPFNPHGGTRFIKFNTNELIGLYHTYNEKKDRIYRIYPITISSSFPHNPLRMSSKPLLDGNYIVPDMLTCDKKCCWLSQKAKVIFERGIAKIGKNFIISYGLQDKLSYLLTIKYDEIDAIMDINIKN